MDNNSVVQNRKFKGINNVNRPEELEPSEFTQAENVYVTDRNTLSRRKGITQLINSTTLHSLGGSSDVTLICEGPNLCILESDYSLTPVYSGIDSSARVSYQPIGRAIYYSDGKSTGRIINGQSLPWASETPAKPFLSTTSGALDGGLYRVVLTYINALGEESGASIPALIEIPPDSGLVVATQSISEGEIRVYMTPANSEEYYYIASTTSGGNVEITNTVNRARPLETNLLSPMPAGHIVKLFKGRLLVANDNALWFSEPFRYGLTKLAYNYFQFRSRITMVEPTEDGIYVSADKTYFLAGADISSNTQIEVSVQPAIFGTSLQIDAAKFSEGGSGIVVLWTSEDGIFMGTESGKISNLTESSVSFSYGSEGAAQFIQADGAAQYVSVLREPSEESNFFGVADKVTAEVYRNGILVEG